VRLADGAYMNVMKKHALQTERSQAVI